MSALTKLVAAIHKRWLELGSIELMAAELAPVLGLSVTEAQELLESVGYPDPTPERMAKMRAALKDLARRVLEGEQV